jgi:hypothetical protein
MTASRYLNETDELIVRAAGEILNRAADAWHDHVMDAPQSELLNIGRMQGKMEAASRAISAAPIAVESNAEHYPPTVPEPEPQAQEAS